MCFKFQKNDFSNLEFSWRYPFYRPDNLQTRNFAATILGHKTYQKNIISSTYCGIVSRNFTDVRKNSWKWQFFEKYLTLNTPNFYSKVCIKNKLDTDKANLWKFKRSFLVRIDTKIVFIFSYYLFWHCQVRALGLWQWGYYEGRQKKVQYLI